MVESEIGRGAFGRVYRARDELIGRPVAIKVIALPSGATQENRIRVLREARAIGRLRSAHIVTLYGVHEDVKDERYLFEMEYIEGGSLAGLLANGSVAEPLALEIAVGMAEALRTAHEAGIVHGDIKPANVLLAGGRQVKLADFGLSRLLAEPSVSCSSVRLEGTPAYMAPEVILGGRPTPATDVWSFGVVLYRMLSGRLPFDARALPSLFHAIQNTEPAPLPPGLESPLARLALRCLEKVPEMRPFSFAEICAALGKGGHGLGDPRPTGRVASPGVVLIGREREVRQLRAALEGAMPGRGQCVLITGPMGVGRSALARHALAVAGARGSACIDCTMMSMRGVMRPLLEAARSCLEAATGSSNLDPKLGSASGIARRLLEEETTLRLESRAEALWAIEQLLAGLAQSAPAVVLLEDIHEATDEDARTLAYLVRRVPALGVLLLLTGRTDAGAPGGALTSLASLDGIVHLPLEPLAREDAYRLLASIAGVMRVDAEVARRVQQAAQGNPLITAELHRELVSTRALAVQDETLVPGPNWQRATFPARLVDLCAARLGRLGPEEREILDYAAVDGPVVDADAIAALLDLPVISVLRRLQQIYRRHGFVRPDRSSFRFSNPLFRESIYSELSSDLRRALHLGFAQHIEATAPNADPERLGAHWEQAGDPVRARPHLRRAAAQAAYRQELHRAMDLARRGGIAPGAIDPATLVAEANLVIILADSYNGAGRPQDAEDLLTRLCEAAADHEEIRLKAFVQRAILRYQRRGVSAEEEGALRDAAQRLGVSREKGLAHYCLGTMAKYRGQLDEAESRLRAADLIFRDLRLDALHSSALDQLASVSLRRGRLREARALYQDAARIATHVGRRTNAAASRVNAALASFEMGSLDGVSAVLEGCIAELDLEGAESLGAHARILLGDVQHAAGNLATAEHVISKALSTLEKSSYLPGLSVACLGMAELRGIRGAIVEAEALLGRGLEACRRSEAVDQQVQNLGLGALIAAWEGDRDRAAARAAEGLSLARGLGAIPPPFLATLAQCALFLGRFPQLDAALAEVPAADGEDVVRRVALPFARAVLEVQEGRLPAPACISEMLEGSHGRASYRVLGHALATRERELARDEPGSRGHAMTGLAAARDLGHVWMELLFLRALGLQDGPRKDLIARLAAQFEGGRRAAFQRFWSPADPPPVP